MWDFTKAYYTASLRLPRPIDVRRPPPLASAVAMQYAKASAHPMVIVVPHSAHAVYFGPHSTHPEDEEALIDYRHYLKGIARFTSGGILYIVAEEKERDGNFNGARP